LVVGAGAAGFFAAINAKAVKPQKRVLIIEKTGKILSKVLVSGGGRCNVTHNETDLAALLTNYPRGKGLLKWTLRKWSVTNTIRWFERHGVALKTEEDGRMFPVTNKSSTIIDCLMQTAQNLGVQWETKTGMELLRPLNGGGFEVETSSGQLISAKTVILACGGWAKSEQYDFLRELGIEIINPVPSLFTFNVPDTPLKELQGVSVPWGRVKITGMEGGTDNGWFAGPVLITHWGLSGPAVLKASAFLARNLEEVNYVATALVDWTGMGEEKARSLFEADLLMNAAKKIINVNPFGLPKRLWVHILNASAIDEDKTVRDLSKSEKNKILEFAVRTPLNIQGKTTFKEEFVTAGGVATTEVDKDSMESKSIPGLFFAGEILDVDGITGGFNFQAAWSTGYVAGVKAAEKA
jgi:predicted Rossmann fold flavoprotein